MDDLTPGQEEAVAATAGAIQRIAMAVVELPTEGRAAHYAMVRRNFQAAHGGRHRRRDGACVAKQHDARYRIARQRDRSWWGCRGGKSLRTAPVFNDANVTRARVPRTNSRAQITRVLADILCQAPKDHFTLGWIL